MPEPHAGSLHNLIHTSFESPLQCDLARQDGWCPAGHADDQPCSRPASPSLHATLDLDTIPNLPTYLDTEIIVVQKYLSPHVVKVLVRRNGNDAEMVCKFATTEMTACATYRELQSLLIITTAIEQARAIKSDALRRIPKLLGIVRSSDHGGVVGMVESFIPHQGTLQDKDLTKVDASRREKWILEINETIAALHQIGITRSDAKAANILINRRVSNRRFWRRLFRRMSLPLPRWHG
ncbi:hypothetical protein F5Y18DRAFT_424485 [Xylariaceae sp. FL1019]|nr:hypothetical protein F5Y18DRAFT_424485 [Xylariaceae sp. FL1019]